MDNNSKKRTSDDIDPSQSIANEGSDAKKSSPVSGPSWTLGKTYKDGRRLAYIDDFKGATLVSFREFYRDSEGQLKPGNKGISLSMDQFKALRSVWTELCEAVDEKTGAQ